MFRFHFSSNKASQSSDVIFLALYVTVARSLSSAFLLSSFCHVSSMQVFQLAAHLVYWGKAIIIYPLCENNVYMLSPNASVCL